MAALNAPAHASRRTHVRRLRGVVASAPLVLNGSARGRVVLALAVYEDVVHVMDIRWGPAGAQGLLQWHFRIQCYDAADLLKQPGAQLPRGSAALRSVMPWYHQPSLSAPLP